jgi:hypothetical protein
MGREVGDEFVVGVRSARFGVEKKSNRMGMGEGGMG